MIVKTNIASVNTNRLSKYQQLDINTNFRKLSSGQRISQAGDDASGYAVTEKMTAQIEGLNQAERNAFDGISFIQTTEGYLSTTNTVLRRIRELAVQAANGVYTTEDRLQIEVEVSQMVHEVDRLASYAQFNGLNMLTGRFANDQFGGIPTASMWFHVGANVDQNIRAYVGTFTANALALKDEAGNIVVSVSAPAKANRTIAVIDDAIKRVNKQVADLGAYQNRLNKVTQSVSIGSENLQAARSRIRDVDMAKEVSDLVRNQILNQAQISMISQANQRAQSVLQLLQ
ncbi:flagellin [Spirochaetota bacterium]|nr:flagellin [Spirochaetota bacterium]